jgi:hypothetical protein
MDDACTYCMGSDVSISSRIYLYSSYFGSERRISIGLESLEF